ncbi:HAD-like protein, partial [Neoconidiobolus thromboides FSU 785]
VLVCCDFDGTITLQDTGVILIDKCIGTETRKALDEKAMIGESKLRDIFKQMWDGVNLTWEEALVLLKDVELDPKFEIFAEYCFSNSIPFHVFSGGLEFMIEYFLRKFFPNDYTNFKIRANYGVLEGRKWICTFKDESEFGHDKGLSMDIAEEEYKREHGEVKPFIIFCGDGVSDLSAARRADVLFARRGRGLEKYCMEHGIKYVPFDDFQIV